MSADVGPELPPGVEVVARVTGADPRLVDAAGLLRPQRAQDAPGLVGGAGTVSVASDERVTPHAGSRS